MTTDRISFINYKKTTFLNEASKTFVSIKHCTSFTPEVVEHLEKTNPSLLAWLRSTCGFVFQGALIFFYIIFETISGLLLSYVLKPIVPPKFTPLPSSIIVMKSFFSIVIGVLATACASVCSERTLRAVPAALKALFDCRRILSFSITACLLSVADVFGLMAYTKLDAGVKKILDQLRLPITAAMSTIIVGKHYSMREWLALSVMLVGICTFYTANTEHDETTALHTTCRYPQYCFNEPTYDICARQIDGATVIGTAGKVGYKVKSFQVDATAATELAGLIFSLVASVSNCAGVLINEKLLKRDAAIPFYAQKVQTEITILPVAIAMSFLVPVFIDRKGGKAIWWEKNETEGSGEGFFQGYTSLTVVVIAVGLIQSWMGGLIVKRFSALVQKISKCFILILMVFLNSAFFSKCQADPLPMTMYSLAFVVAAATMLFASMPKDAAPPALPPVPLPSTGSPILGSNAGSMVSRHGESALETLLQREQFVRAISGSDDKTIQLQSGSLIRVERERGASG